MADRDENWERVPSYVEVSKCVYDFITYTASELFQGKPSIQASQEHWQYFNFTANDTLLVTFLAFAFTVLRFLMTDWYFKPLAQRFNLTPANAKKMPESAWKFLYYLCAWSYAFYVVILSGRYRFFQCPSTVWTGWSLNASPPADIYWMYMIQLGFYVHSLYATVFLDAWRKDSVVMLVHHVLTLVLVSISYSLRYHNIGSLVLFVHDVCDILLEFTKLNVYFKVQAGKRVYRHDLLANLTFAFFTLAWFVFRLYYYPLKLLCAATCDIRRLQLNLPCAALMNTLLWILQILNIYWFLFIVKLLVRVATGKVKEVEDTREYDDDNDFVNQLTKKSIENSHVLHNGTVTNNGFAGVPQTNGNDHGLHLRDRRKAPH